MADGAVASAEGDQLNDEVQRALDLLEAVGAEETDHPSGTLAGHLRGTYEQLQGWNCPQRVCLAGLYHSVYGTDVFRTVTLAPDARDKVKQAIGSDAENLVYLYCSMVRESLYENLSRGGPPYGIRNRRDETLISVDLEDYASLLTIDLANRMEQMSESRWSRDRFAIDRPRYLAAAPLLPPAAVAALHAQRGSGSVTRGARKVLGAVRRGLRS